jgi:hypothetical protein
LPGLPRLGRYCRHPQCRAIRATGQWGHRCLDHAHGRVANTHLTTIMIAEKLVDEIRREAKAGSVEHSTLNSRLGANVCIWHFSEEVSEADDVRSQG